ncbi:MAG TPA: hypothetical protein VMD05_10400 [Candidatus Nanoarchaeia archaeon]|nr:hypothetical protein [Candidatus Nanoarchaeia archaeon]
MDSKFKAFHFKEIDFFISFPVGGNVGKYADYDVIFVDGSSESRTLEKKVKLHEILDLIKVEQNYPHTVGYFKTSCSGDYVKPEYLELREIRTVEEFWAFLNAVNL